MPCEELALEGAADVSQEDLRGGGGGDGEKDDDGWMDE